MQQLMSGGSTAPNAKETMLYRILTDEKRLGFESEEEAAYLNLMLIQGAADTVLRTAIVSWISADFL